MDKGEPVSMGYLFQYVAPQLFAVICAFMVLYIQNQNFGSVGKRLSSVYGIFKPLKHITAAWKKNTWSKLNIHCE